MEGGFPFGMFGDPGDMQKHLQDMAEQMQTAQKVGWADNAINLAVQMTVASIARLDLSGKPEEQAAQVLLGGDRLCEYDGLAAAAAVTPQIENDLDSFLE